MIAVRLAWLELRRFRGRVLRYAALSVLVMIPMLYAALYLWSNWDPYGNSDRVPVAVVDQDAGVQLGQDRVVAGSEFVDQLHAAPVFDWSFVDAARAAEGMRDGDFYFAVVVPEDFSASLATSSPSNSHQAHMTVKLDDSNGYVAGVMAKTMQSTLQNQINAAVHAAFAKSFFDDLNEFHERLNDAAVTAAELEAGVVDIDEGLDELAVGLTGLTDAAGQVSDGNDRLSSAVEDAADSVDSASAAADGALADLKAELDAARDACQGEGCAQLESAAAAADAVIPRLQGDLATAAQTMQDGVAEVQPLARDAREVADDSGQALADAADLADGADELSASDGQLASGLEGAAAQTPSTDPTANAAAAEALGSMVAIEEHTANASEVYGRGMAPFFFAAALWVFGLAAYKLLRTVNPRALAGRANALTVALSGWLPALVLGVAAALALYLVVDVGLGLNPRNITGTIGLCVLGVAAFTAVAHFLRLAFGAAGDVLVVLLLAVQLAAAGGGYPIETSPALFQAVHPFLPMTYLVEGLRVTISGGPAAQLWQAAVVLGCVTAAAVAASSVTVMRRRRWTMARLRPAISV